MSRPPGPMCVTKLGYQWIDAGTTALKRNYSPGPIASAVPAAGSVRVPSDIPARLLLAAQSGIPLLPAELKQRLAPLLTYEGMAVIAGSVLAIGAAHAVGVGFVLDIAVGAFTVAVIGADLLEAGRRASNFYEIAIAARTEGDFDKAGREFAAFVSIAGINTVILLLARARPSAAPSASSLNSQSVGAAWSSYIGRITFKVPAGKGILWSQIGSRPAEKMARSKGLVSLEMLLKDEGFMELYARQFGSSKTELTGDIWRKVSQRYAASLEGKVSAFVNEKKLSTELVSRAEPMLQPGQRGVNPVLIDEIEEIAELMAANGRITSVEMIDVASGRSWIMARGDVLRAAKTAESAPGKLAH